MDYIGIDGPKRESPIDILAENGEGMPGEWPLQRALP